MTDNAKTFIGMTFCAKKRLISKALNLSLIILMLGVAQLSAGETARSGWVASEIGRMAYVTDGRDLLLNWRPYAKGLPAVSNESFTYQLSLNAQVGELVLENKLAGNNPAISKLVLILLEGDSQKASVNLFALAGFISSQLAVNGQRIIVGHLGNQLNILGEIEAPEDLGEMVARMTALPDSSLTPMTARNMLPRLKTYLGRQPESRKAVITQLAAMDAWVNVDQDFVFWSRMSNTVFYPLVMPGDLSHGVRLAALTGARALPWLGSSVAPVVAASNFREQHAGGLLLYKLQDFYRLPFEGEQRLEGTLTINDQSLRGQFVVVPEPAGLAVLLDPRNWIEWIQVPGRSIYGYLMFFLLAFLLVWMLLMMWTLVYRPGSQVFAKLSLEDTGEVVRVTRFPFTIGRAKRCDLCLDDETVSRLHAQLELAADGGLVLTDLQSGNGTYLNEHAVTSVRLGMEEDMRFGRAGVHFRILKLPR